jgi:SAM-dependent methyltransferase
MDLERVKAIEKEHFERKRDGEGPLPPVVVDQIRERELRPCYGGGSDRYSDNKMAFHEVIATGGGWEGKTVLDYGCGNGTWATYFALTGAAKVSGFDLAESGVRRGMDRVRTQGLEDKVELCVMDATNLTFPDAFFDVVIGTAVLHHVLKYPGVFEHLHRVMKPGAKAYFLENLADFPLFRLWWWLKGPVESGDVPIFSRDILDKSRSFSDVTIIGDDLLFSIKTFLCAPDMGRLRKVVLRSSKIADSFLFSAFPQLRRWGSFCYIELRK